MSPRVNTQQGKILAHVDREYQDKQNPVTAYGYEYYIAANGYGYILYNTKKSKVIDCAIKLINYRQQTADGVRDNAKVSISMKDSSIDFFKVKNNGVLLIYKDYKIIVNNLYDYNENANQYQYTGEILENINEQFIIIDTLELVTYLATTSLNKWLEYTDEIGVPIYPAYIAPYNINTSYMTVEILETKSNHDTKLIDADYLRQNNTDNVKLTLYNADTQTAQKVLYNIQQLGVTYNNSMGTITTPSWATSYDTKQDSFGILSNKKECELKVNYNLIVNLTEPFDIKYLKKVLATINDYEITLYNEE